jgi:hypothetical protein
VVTPGITIKDRLRVLQPSDPDSYYASRELVPLDMLNDIKRAKILITNYHARSNCASERRSQKVAGHFSKAATANRSILSKATGIRSSCQ